MDYFEKVEYKEWIKLAFGQVIGEVSTDMVQNVLFLEDFDRILSEAKGETEEETETKRKEIEDKKEIAIKNLSFYTDKLNTLNKLINSL